MISDLFQFVRELVLLAAGAGIAWWCWDAFKTRRTSRDEAARAALSAERRTADARQLQERIEARLGAIANRLDELASRSAAQDELASDKVRIHALLQATTDPYLSFDEIERALSAPDPQLSGAEASPDTGTNSADRHPPLSGDRLRRALIELVRDGAAAQMDRDRYFIASDYETGDDVGEQLQQR